MFLDTSRARQIVADAEVKWRALRKELEKAENDLKEIFNVHGYGAEGEWKKLDDTCLRMDVGE